MLKRIMFMTITIFTIININVSVFAEPELNLTQEEKDYIAKKIVIKAVSVDGGAPLHYIDSKGEIKGIAVSVLDKIADMTGLIFEYRLYDSIEKAFKSNSDILFGVTYHHAPAEMVLSQSYLKSETILYINSSLDSNELEDKVYAAFKGADLPEGVREENIIYYDTREGTMDAVEAGEADYGYGNAYSVAFYMLQNGYKNIVTIPKGKESREYCIGFPKEDEVLLSIINKAIDAIDENKMQTLILDVASQVDRKITFSMVIDAYGKWIFGIIFLAISILSFSVVSNVRSNKRLKTQNKINEMLSQISNEYLYEYFVKTNHLELSKKYTQLFGTPKQLKEASNMLKNTLLNNNLDGNISEIRLPLAHGETGIFKSIALNMFDKKGKLDFIVGKMVDISEEIREKKRLVTKSEKDGLTGLYNAATVKEFINESIKTKDKYEVDVLIAIDCDKFKYINDTYGHLAGDMVLKNVSKGLGVTFRQNDIIGRIGGDEFCVYMKNVPMFDLVQLKCQQLNRVIQEINRGFHISVSCGIAFLKGESTYEELFAKADKALYEAKGKGGGKSVIYREDNNATVNLKA